MPLVDLTEPDIFQPTGQATLGPYRPPAETPSPGLGATLGAAFRQDNILASIAANNLAGVDNNPEEGYNAWQDIAGTKYERHWERFARVNNRRYAAALKMQFDMEEDDRRTLAAAGIPGMVASLAAGILDPTILLPGGALVKTGSLGYSVSRSALAVGMAAGAGVAVQEAFLQGTQETRSMGESAINVGGGVVLGALLGGAAARLLSPGERAAALRSLDNVARGSETFGDAPPARGLSAESVEKPTLDDLTVSGRAAGVLAKVTGFLSPQLRMAQNPSAAARRVFEEMAEGTVYRNMHSDGRTLGPAVETLARAEFEPRLAQAVTETDSIYREMKKAGINMSRDDFEVAVGRAMRRGDVADDGNQYVGRAAAVYRSRLFDPLKERAIQSSLLPEDVSVDTALSYFSRIYDRERLIAREDEFKGRVLPYIQGKIEAAYNDAAEALRRRQAATTQRIADLRLSPEERVRILDELETRAERLDAENADVIDARANIRDLERAARENPAAAAQNQQEIARIRAAYGERLLAYEAAARELRSRRRGVQMGYAAMADRAERNLQTIAEIEETNFRAMGTLLRKGQEFAGSGSTLRANPKQYAERANGIVLSVDNLAKALERTAQKAEDSVARIVEQSAKAAETGGPAPGGEKMLDFLRKNAAVARQRATEIREMAERLKITRDLDDLDGLRSEIIEAMDAVARQASGASLARGARAERLRAKLPDFDPKKVDAQIEALEAAQRDMTRKFLDRWEIKNQGQGIDVAGGATPNFRTQADDVVEQVVRKILGRDAEAGVLPDWATPVTRGPMKDRTFMVPDELIEDFLESNARYVAERYGRTMAAETYLTEKFGRADMKDQFAEIANDFGRLRKEAEALPAAQREKKLKELDAAERQAKDDIAAVRDIIRGTYAAAANASDFGRISRALTNFNYLRQMGGAALSSLSEFYRGAMVHGLVPYFRDAVLPLMSNTQAIRMSVGEARAAGLITERVLQHRLATVAELGDPYARGSSIERLLEQGSRVASKWNFLPLLTDMQESISAVASQNRLLGILERMADGKAVKDADQRLAAFLGVDRSMAERIGALYRQHGETLDGVRVANTEAWGDAVAAQVFRAAINKDVRSMIVRPGAGDLPLFARTPLGRMMLQFRSFTIAAHQRVTLRGLQEDQSRFVGGMVAMAGFGMMVAYLKSLRQGEEAHNRFVENAKNNPFFLVGEGFDNANPVPLMMDVSNTIGRVTQGVVPGGFNPIKTPIRALGGGTEQASVRGNYVDVWGSLLGPSANLVSDAAKAAGIAGSLGSGETPKEAQMNAALRLVPYNSFLGMREMLQAIHGDSPYVRTR